MPGARQPIELLQANGNKHLTKAEIEYRKNVELKINAGDIIAPDYLPEKLKSEFDDIADKLKSVNIMTELDTDCLARYLLSKQMYLTLTSKLMSETKKNNYQVIDKLMTMQDKTFKQCQSCASSLGLTISSRCKITTPVKEEKPKENPFLSYKSG